MRLRWLKKFSISKVMLKVSFQTEGRNPWVEKPMFFVRLVANRVMQEGVEFNEICLPVFEHKCIGFILSLVHNSIWNRINWTSRLFFHHRLNVHIYMKQPGIQSVFKDVSPWVKTITNAMILSFEEFMLKKKFQRSCFHSSNTNVHRS